MKQFFSLEELTALQSLITFHDDWEEVSEIVGADVETLYDKVTELISNDEWQIVGL